MRKRAQGPLASHELSNPCTVRKPQGTHAVCGIGWRLECNRHFEVGEKPTASKLKTPCNEIRRERFPWRWEVTKNASDQPSVDLGKAFSALCARRASRVRLKSKKRSSVCHTCSSDGVHMLAVPPCGTGLLSGQGDMRTVRNRFWHKLFIKFYSNSNFLTLTWQGTVRLQR